MRSCLPEVSSSLNIDRVYCLLCLFTSSGGMEEMKKGKRTQPILPLSSKIQTCIWRETGKGIIKWYTITPFLVLALEKTQLLCHEYFKNSVRLRSISLPLNVSGISERSRKFSHCLSERCVCVCSLCSAHVWVNEYVCVCLFVCIVCVCGVCVCTQVYVYACLFVCMCMYQCVYVCVCSCMHTV